MTRKKADQARNEAMERNDEYYNTFEREFAEKIASGSGTPADGLTRMQILEQLMRAMNSDIKDSNLKYVSGMIDSIDEDEVIESKKENY